MHSQIIKKGKQANDLIHDLQDSPVTAFVVMLASMELWQGFSRNENCPDGIEPISPAYFLSLLKSPARIGDGNFVDSQLGTRDLCSDFRLNPESILSISGIGQDCF